MTQNSLVSRTTLTVEFQRTNVDRFRFDWSSLVSPRHLGLEQAFLSVQGYFDVNGEFLNDLRIYVRYLDNNLTEHVLDISDRIGRHYASFIRTSIPISLSLQRFPLKVLSLLRSNKDG